ncbi:SMC-Scp complex subunit ScpB [Vreelandella aquamarina]
MTDAATTLDDILEAALLAAGEPLALERLETLFREAECPSRTDFRQSLSRLGEKHASGALELLETASGYQLRIRPRLSPWVSRLWDERPQRYSRALLETLALIAYRQPVTRGDIEEVRGVAVSSTIMRTLMERGWIRVVGHRDVPGRPAVFATTRSFLDDFGLKTLDALPPMHALVAESEEAPDERFMDVLTSAGLEEPGEQVVSDVHESDSDNGESYSDNENSALDGDVKTVQDAPPETANEADPHAETALTQPLSFADLEARLAAREQPPSHHDGPTEKDIKRSDDHESESEH